MAELAHVQCVGLLVLVLEMALERVVAAEGASAVGTLLGLVDAPCSWRRHPHHGAWACNSHATGRDGARVPYTTCQQPTQKKQLKITSERR